MKTYINMTAGLEAIPVIADEETPINFIRIQSSHLETKHFWKVIRDIDIGFMIDIFTTGVNVYDASRKRPMSRALFQGVPWIVYAVQMTYWRDYQNDGANPPEAFVKGMNVTSFFDDVYFLKHLTKQNKIHQSLSESRIRNEAIKKLRYVCQLLGNKINEPKYELSCVNSMFDGLLSREQYGKAFLVNALDSYDVSENHAYEELLEEKNILEEDYILLQMQMSIMRKAIRKIVELSPDKEPALLVEEDNLSKFDYLENGSDWAYWNVLQILNDMGEDVEELSNKGLDI